MSALPTVFSYWYSHGCLSRPLLPCLQHSLTDQSWLFIKTTSALSTAYSHWSAMVAFLDHVSPAHSILSLWFSWSIVFYPVCIFCQNLLLYQTSTQFYFTTCTHHIFRSKMNKLTRKQRGRKPIALDAIQVSTYHTLCCYHRCWFALRVSPYR